MVFSTVFSNLLIWSLIGCMLFLAMVVAFFRTGLVYTARKKYGALKDDIPSTVTLRPTFNG